MNRRIQRAVSVAVSGLLIYALLRYFDVRQIVGVVRGTDPLTLILGMTLMVAAYVVRGARWRIWEAGLSYWDSLRLILIGCMGANVLPGRQGEILRAHCAAARMSRMPGRTALAGSIAVERILDGLVLGLFGMVGVALVPLARPLQWAMWVLSVGFVGLALTFVLGILCHGRTVSFIAAAHRKFPGHMTAFARDGATHFLEAFLPLGSLSRMLGAIAGTTLIWGLEFASGYLIGRSVWGEMSVRMALLAVVVVKFASLIPLTVGGIGTVEVIGPVFLISSGIPPYPAIVIVLWQHAGQYLFTTIAGGIAYFMGGFSRLPRPYDRTVIPGGTVPEAGRVIEETRSRLGQLRGSVPLKPAVHIKVDLSIVIPAYNEQARLPRTVLETIHWCTSRNVEFELIIADDGSRDETLALARLFEETDVRIRSIACPHMGKGATVRMGVLNAKGRLILFMDADGATPLSEIPKLLAAIEEGHEVAIGSRVIQRPGEVEVKTSFFRRIVGRIFAFFVNLFAIEGLADTQCGFKIFRREAAMAIFSRQKIVGFAFDVEILFLARRLALSIAEIPVNWVAQPGSKVNIVADSIRMLWDISRVRWMHRNFRANPVRQLQRSLETGPTSL
jgi:dolichyl-phosphate beta-glucosyltransferase